MTSIFKHRAAATVALLSGLGLVFGLSTAASADEQLSDKSVQVFMDYAWSLVPQQFTEPNGKTILIDKKKKSEIVVPLDVAREIIRVGRMSAHAQICQLQDERIRNNLSMVQREIDKKKWTEQQLIYISQLHLTTIMLLTGKLKAESVDDKGNKEVVLDDSSNATKTCTPEERTKVKDVIDAYVKAGPPLPSYQWVNPASDTTAAAANPTSAKAATATTAPVATQPASVQKK